MSHHGYPTIVLGNDFHIHYMILFLILENMALALSFPFYRWENRLESSLPKVSELLSDRHSQDSNSGLRSYLVFSSWRRLESIQRRTASYPGCSWYSLVKDRRGFRTNSFPQSWYRLLGLSVRFAGLRTQLLLGEASFVPFIFFFFCMARSYV